MLDKARYAVAAAGGLLTATLGGWDLALKVLVGFVAMDYVTGVYAAWYEQRLDSDVGLRGISKKLLLFAIVGIAHWLDQLLATELLRSLAIWFYLAGEGLSILENAARAGVPVPSVLKAALVQLHQKGDRGVDS